MDQTAPKRPRRWRDWLLVASLGLNLAILGLAAGAILRGPPERMAAGPGLWQYARALPDPYRQDSARRCARAAASGHPRATLCVASARRWPWR